jgi:beta-galactosidase
MYQGGYIWDYIDQAVYAKDRLTGRNVLCYGGDFDDRPSDYEFSGNGIVFADRTEKPAMQEVRYYYGLHK